LQFLECGNFRHVHHIAQAQAVVADLDARVVVDREVAERVGRRAADARDEEQQRHKETRSGGTSD